MKYLLLFLLIIQSFSVHAGRKINNAGPTPPAIVLYVNKTAAGANDGSSWANAYNNLQDALANNNAGITQIWVAKGTYYPDEGGGKTDNDRNASFSIRNNLAVYGGFAGTETQVTQRNWNTNITFLSGDIDKNDGAGFANNSGNSYHVLDLSGSDNTVVLDGFIIRSGNANGESPLGEGRLDDGTLILKAGGGIYISQGGPVIANCIITGNSADGHGGGFFNRIGNTSASITVSPSLTNCRFLGNNSEFEGGGIYCSSSGTTVVNCTFSKNTATGPGGGIYFGGYPSLTPKIINSSFSGNTASGAGDLFIDNTALPVTNCIFWGSSSAIDNTVNDFEPASPVITYSIVQGGYTGTANLDVNPLFVDALNGVLEIQQGSPARNSGSDAANSEPFDLNGNARKVGVIDRGAYELQSTCPSGNILYVNASANGNNDGSSWNNAFTKLQDALSSTCAGINQIWVAKGTYYPDEGIGQTDNDREAFFAMKNNLAIYGGFAGTETQLSQRNWTTNVTILSGDLDQNDQPGFMNRDNNAHHVVKNLQSNLDHTAILDGFKITGGNASDALTPLGGGMFNNVGAPSVINCTFVENSAADGSAIFNANAGGSALITNCTFQSNSGSGIYNYGSSPTITGCSFYNNFGFQGGGGIFNSNGSPIVTNCTFSGNTGGTSGAAMKNLNQSGPSVSNCIFWGDASEINVTQDFIQPNFTNCIIQGGFSGTGILDQDPLFVNASNGNLHLQSCSPALDAGDDGVNNQTADLDGNNRKVDAIAGGNKIDMGAFEYKGTLPSATISGTATVCQNKTPSPNITFTATGGSGHYTFNYTLNGDSKSVTTISGNSITVAVPTDVVGTFTYVLLSVQDDVSSCPQNVSNQSAIIKVNGQPTAQISGGTIVCENGNQPQVTLSGSGGQSTYLFSYVIFDGTNTSITSATGNPLLLNAPTGTPGNFTYSILSVTNVTTNCGVNVSGQSATISVVPLPLATISAGSPVTAASSLNVASVQDAGSGSTYTWGITNGTITSGAGSHLITYTAGNSGSVSLSVSVTNANNCGPEIGSANILITPLPCPNASITVPASVCSGSTNNHAFVADAGAGAIYQWTITNGSITAGAGTKSISYTAAVNKYADYDDDDYVKLSVTVTNASLVCTQSSGVYKVFISPIPSAVINTSSVACSNSAGNLAWVAYAGSGATYTWTITNGTITAGAGTKSILYTAGTSGSVSLAVTVTNSKGCSGSSGTKLIPIASLPTANLTAATPVCAGSGGNIATVTNGGTGTKYCWTISNGCINSGGSTNSITYTVGSSGTAVLTVLVTNSSGCSAPLASKQVTILAPPNAAINTTSGVCGGSSNTATALAGASGYSWAISNGTITHGAGTNSITYTAGSSGTISLAVTVTNSSGCKSTGKSSVSIKAAPSSVISTSTPVCAASAGNTASVSSAGSGATYIWTISNGTITTGAGTAAIKYTAGASGTVSLGVTVTVSGGCKSTGNKSVSITAKVTPSFAAMGTLCQGSKAPVLSTTSVNGIKGSWNPSTVSTASTGTKTYTFTPAAGQCAASVSKTITVQKCTSTTDAGSVNAKVITEEVTSPTLDVVILPNPSQTYFTLLIKGNRKEIAEVRVFDLLGRALDHLKANTGESVQFGGRYVQGMYIVEVMQGPERKVLKALKQ